MEVRPVAPAPLELPAPFELAPALAARVTPSAMSSEHYIAGEIVGGELTYGDLYAFAWYVPGGGFLTTNRGQRRLTRSTHGAEDTRGRRRRS